MKHVPLVLDIEGVLHLDGWAGRRTYRVQVIGETRAYFRFRALEDIPMPSRRWLKPGDSGRAPKHAITLASPPEGARNSERG
jgi:hypothetical protein